MLKTIPISWLRERGIEVLNRSGGQVVLPKSTVIEAPSSLKWWRFAPWQLQHLNPSDLKEFINGLQKNALGRAVQAILHRAEKGLRCR